MTTTTTRPVTVRELQAAAAALAAGQFGPAASRAPGGDLSQPIKQTVTVPAGVLDSMVRVRAANAGAGASTVALALTDAADTAGVRTRLLDAAAPAWSGLLGATATELGASDGWRRGRRGSGVLIDRVADPVVSPSHIPAPREVEGVELTVLDAGWSARELQASPGSWITSCPAEVEVVVTRTHELALSQTEAALHGLADRLEAGRVLVVGVGATRWSGAEFAAAGRLLHDAHEMGALVFAPLLTPRVLPVLGPAALPKQLTSPSQQLLERITTVTGPLTANRA